MTAAEQIRAKLAELRALYEGYQGSLGAKRQTYGKAHRELIYALRNAAPGLLMELEAQMLKLEVAAESPFDEMAEVGRKAQERLARALGCGE